MSDANARHPWTAGGLLAIVLLLTGSAGAVVLERNDPLLRTGLENATCGDGSVQDYEQCDDGNTVDGDDCAANCQLAVCGNAFVEPGEECDDANPNPGDGCTGPVVCEIEPGYACAGEPSVCTTQCGDGFIAGVEACDDGNSVNGDGCDQTCAIENGFSCSGMPSVCLTTCGDGIPAGGETCDDGNLVDGDGCTSVCSVDNGYQCIGVPSVCMTVCGDSIIAGGETCDDGNTVDGDGCSAMCQIEQPTPAIVGTDYAVVAHGGRLLVTGLRFTGATSVTIGGTTQPFMPVSDTQLSVGVLDGTPIGSQPLVVSNAEGASAPFALTVIRLRINESDADQAGTDAAEFVEIATGVPNVNLDGYVLTFWNGANDLSYLSIALAATTDANGLLLVGNPGVMPLPALGFPGNVLQNGADAISLHQQATPHPNGTPVTSSQLVDALVYGTADPDDAELLATLLGVGPERVQLDEGATGVSDLQSVQRCESTRRLDGRSFQAGSPPSPGAANAVPGC